MNLQPYFRENFYIRKLVRNHCCVFLEVENQSGFRNLEHRTKFFLKTLAGYMIILGSPEKDPHFFDPTKNLQANKTNSIN